MSERWKLKGAIFFLALLPAILLFRPLFLGAAFVPFDLAIFPPGSSVLDQESLQTIRDAGNVDVTEKSVICTPEFRFARDELAAGRLPHWNPYVRAGAPLFANALDGFAYPTHWLFLLFDPETGYGYAAYLAFLLAGLFTFGFLRKLGLSVLPACAGATLYQLSGTMTANAQFFMRMEPLIWLPALCWALEAMRSRRGLARAVPGAGFAISLALSWLAGFPPFALVVSLAAGLWGIRVVFLELQAEGLPAGRSLALWILGFLVLGLGVAAVQVVPMLDYFPESQRDLDQTYAELVAQGFDWSGLHGFLMPSPYTSPLAGTRIDPSLNPLLYLDWGLRNPEDGKLFLPGGYYNFTEYAVYLGALPLLLMLLALFGKAQRGRGFAASMFVLFLLLGSAGIVFRLAWYLPLFRSTPPFRFLSVLPFFAAMLLAMGLERGVASWSRRRFFLCVSTLGLLTAYFAWQFVTMRGLLGDPNAGVQLAEAIRDKWATSYPAVASDAEKILGILGSSIRPSLERFASQSLHALLMLSAGLIALLLWRTWAKGMHGERRAKLVGGVVLAIFASELLWMGMQVNPSFERRGRPESPILSFLRKQREARADEGGFMVARVSRAPQTPSWLPPGTLVPERIRDLNSYAFVDRRSNAPFAALYGPSIRLRGQWLNSFPADERLFRGLFDLYGVRYVLAMDALESPLGGHVGPLVKTPEGTLRIHERRTAMPRAFLVPRAETLQSDEAQTRRLISADFDPRSVLFLDQGDCEDGLPSTTQASQAEIQAAKLRFKQDDPSEITISIEDCPGAWLLLTDTAMKHWYAELNGEAARWYRADLCFRAVWVPKGTHELRYYYAATPFWTGLSISLLSLAGILVLFVIGRRARPIRTVDVEV